MLTNTAHIQSISQAPYLPVEFSCPDPTRIVRSARASAERGDAVMPAWFLYEWVDYTVVVNGADLLLVGSTRLAARAPGVFFLRFENQLDYTTIQPFAGNRPLSPAVSVEVIASKFAHPSESIRFTDILLGDLFARDAALPFLASALTGRLVQEARRPPTPLFVFHFFRRYGRELELALEVIAHRPLRRLADRIEDLTVDQAVDVDLDAMMSILQSATTNDREATSVIHRLRPAKIRQRLPIETIDTPENRFVLSAAGRFLAAIEALERASWYRDDQRLELDRKRIGAMASALRMFMQDRQFQEVGKLDRFPMASRVLQRRDGYRELTTLWFSFQRARQPLFDRLEHAIDIRDIATLYEFWVFFELAARIGTVLGVEGQFLEHPGALNDELNGIRYGARFRYEGVGDLYYNLSMRGYSGIWLRPDYLWKPSLGRAVAFDAKFRMEKLVLAADDGIEPASDGIAYDAKDDDLAKMHAYRDALGVRAAVVIFPGTESKWLPTEHASAIDCAEADMLASILMNDELEGVGAIAMSPAPTQSE